MADPLVTREGFDELQQALNQAPDVVLPILAEAIDNSLRAVYAVAEPYPPETIANSPQNETGRWYERHFGPRWIRKRQAAGLDLSGITKRKQVNVLEGAGIIGGRNTSQQLQLRWKLNSAIVGDAKKEVRGSLANTATYAVPVKGRRGEQSPVMSNIGWSSIDDDIAQAGDMIDAALDEAMDRVMEILRG